jgi:uncharacterized protein YxeA
MKKILIIVIIVVLIVTTVAGIVFTVIYQSSSSSKSLELVTVQFENASTQAALKSTADAAATAQLAASSAQFAGATAQFAAYATHSAKVLSLSSTMDAQVRQISDLRSSNDCVSKPISIDYSNSSSISNSLKTWLEDTQGSIDNVKWENVWNNSKTKIYKFTGQYLYVFSVYFDDTSLGNKNSVFDVGNSCWLDR